MASNSGTGFEVEPYSFEPLAQRSPRPTKAKNTKTDTSKSSTKRIGSKTWCLCGQCETMPTDEECLCCREIGVVANKLGDTFKCVKMLRQFQVNCLDKDVIETSFWEYEQNHGPFGDEEPLNQLYRHVAYRRFIYWIWHKLGRKNRRVIPACAVLAIRNAFPSDIYTGFKDS